MDASRSSLGRGPTDLTQTHRAETVARFEPGGRGFRADALVVEEPLEIRLNDQILAVTMRTPGCDAALAVGFLAAEGALLGPDDLFDVTTCPDPTDPDTRNVVTVYAADRAARRLEPGGQRYATSSCGLCGRAAIDSVRSALTRTVEPSSAPRDVVLALPDRLRAAQSAFERTGGLHAAGLFNRQGQSLYVEEDVGRHNAVDKVLGRAFLDGEWPVRDAILVCSGRAGFEIVQKAAAAAVPIVCSVSAPSSLAVDLARASGITLIGFLRGETFNLYSGDPDSIVG